MSNSNDNNNNNDNDNYKPLIPDVTLDTEEFHLNKLIWLLESTNHTYYIAFKYRNFPDQDPYFVLEITLPDYISVNPTWIDEIQKLIKVVAIDPDWQKGKGLILRCTSWKQIKKFDKQLQNEGKD